MTGQANTTVEEVTVSTAANLNGWLYHDENRNGHADDGEAALADIQLLITAVDRPARAVHQLVTYANGSFALRDLSPGKYTVVPILPNDLVALNPAAGELTLSAGSSAELGDFMIFSKAAIEYLYLPLLAR